nr:hypothetical protein [uncultured Sphingosinicella sp.]
MQIRLFRVFSLSALALPVLGGCATQGDFPSLAPRQVERDLTGGSAPIGCPGTEGEAAPVQQAEAQPAPVNPDPQLGARVAELLASARRGQSEFAAVLPAANRAAARAGAAGSENWIAAQQEISRLESARTRTVDALAELDALAIRRSDAPVAEADYQAVLSAAEEVRRLSEAQQAELARIGGRITAP